MGNDRWRHAAMEVDRLKEEKDLLEKRNTEYFNAMVANADQVDRLRAELAEENKRHDKTAKMLDLVEARLNEAKAELAIIKLANEIFTCPACKNAWHKDTCTGETKKALTENAKLKEALKEWEDAWALIKQFRPYFHFCDEWDGLPIDKGEPEFSACQCFPREKPRKVIE